MEFFRSIKQRVKSAIEGDEARESHPRHRRKSASFDVTFADSTLGVSVNAEEGSGVPVVTNVVEGSPAHIGGVERSHYVLAVEGNPVSSHEDLISVINAIGRPVTITFGRRRRSHRADMATEELANSSSRKQSTRPMTEEEKASRREAALKAAEERNQAWEKRLGSSKRPEPKQSSFNPTPAKEHAPSTNPDTQRVVEAAKRAEQKTVAQLGYNPFTPHMSTNAEARYAQAQVQAGPITDSNNQDGGLQSASNSNSNSAISSPRLETQSSDSIDSTNLSLPYVEGELDEAAVAQIEEAVQLLAAQELPVLHLAAQTILKMLGNIALRPDEAKYRTVKLQNKLFHSRVAEVDGGLQTMIAAGFHMQLDSDGASLVYPNPDVPLDESSARLRYTYNRVRMCL